MNSDTEPTEANMMTAIALALTKTIKANNQFRADLDHLHASFAHFKNNQQTEIDEYHKLTLTSLTNFEDTIKGNIKESNVKVTKIMDKTMDTNAELYEELQDLKSEVDETKDLKNRILSLEKELADLQQYIRRPTIEISGVSERIRQSDLEKFVIEQILHPIGVMVTSRDIEACHRLIKRNPQKPAHVVVRFVNRKNANASRSNRYRLKNFNHLRGIWIFDNLCPDYRHIFEELSNLRQQGIVKHVWSYNGKVSYKRTDNRRVRGTRVNHKNDLIPLYPILPRSPVSNDTTGSSRTDHSSLQPSVNTVRPTNSAPAASSDVAEAAAEPVDERALNLVEASVPATTHRVGSPIIFSTAVEYISVDEPADEPISNPRTLPPVIPSDAPTSDLPIGSTGDVNTLPIEQYMEAVAVCPTTSVEIASTTPSLIEPFSAPRVTDPVDVQQSNAVNVQIVAPQPAVSVDVSSNTIDEYSTVAIAEDLSIVEQQPSIEIPTEHSTEPDAASSTTNVEATCVEVTIIEPPPYPPTNTEVNSVEVTNGSVHSSAMDLAEAAVVDAPLTEVPAPEAAAPNEPEVTPFTIKQSMEPNVEDIVAETTIAEASIFNSTIVEDINVESTSAEASIVEPSPDLPGEPDITCSGDSATESLPADPTASSTIINQSLFLNETGDYPTDEEIEEMKSSFASFRAQYAK